MKYFLIVGEASGDLHAGNLIKSIKRFDQDASFAFMGGDKMQEASGTKALVHYRDMAFMGLIPVLKSIFYINIVGKKLQKAILDFQPDVVIPVDYASFSMEYILPFVKENTNVKIVYFIAPKLWAWKSWRIKTLKKYVDLMLCILPFEEKFFLDRDLNSRYIGNPTVDAIRESGYQLSLDFDSISLNTNKQIALLAGSRKEEIKDNLDIMCRAVEKYSQDAKIVLAAAPSIDKSFYQKYLDKYPFLNIVFDETYKTLSKSTLSIVTSGTATLETALIGCPQLVVYRMGGNPLLRFFFDKLFSTKYFSLVNIILDKALVKELLGGEVSVQNIDKELQELLYPSKRRKEILEGYSLLRNTLGVEKSLDKAAQYIISQINNK